MTGSFPPPKDHWLYAPGENEHPASLRSGVACLNERNAWERSIAAAARYAIRAATMNGKEMDFDPDALVWLMIAGLIGPGGNDSP